MKITNSNNKHAGVREWGGGGGSIIKRYLVYNLTISHIDKECIYLPFEGCGKHGSSVLFSTVLLDLSGGIHLVVIANQKLSIQSHISIMSVYTCLLRDVVSMDPLSYSLQFCWISPREYI